MIWLVAGIGLICAYIWMKGLKRIEELREEIAQINRQHQDTY